VYSAVLQYHIKEKVECKIWYNDVYYVFFLFQRYAVPIHVDRHMRGIVTAAWRWLLAFRTWYVCVNHLWPVHVDIHLPLNITGQKRILIRVYNVWDSSTGHRSTLFPAATHYPK
jgi:hypothetical protein